MFAPIAMIVPLAALIVVAVLFFIDWRIGAAVLLVLLAAGALLFVHASKPTAITTPASPPGVVESQDASNTTEDPAPLVKDDSVDPRDTDTPEPGSAEQ